jgi:hypothetical protein
MKTKLDIFKEDIYSPQLISNGEVFFRWRHVEGMMDEWGKQVATALFEEMKAMFDKRERELWEKIEPNMKQTFKYRLYGEAPAETEVIDKWYKQYLLKLENKMP